VVLLLRPWNAIESNIGPDDGGIEYRLEQTEPLPDLEATRMAGRGSGRRRRRWSFADHGKRVNSNDFPSTEQMLMAPAVSLNGIFGEMSRRSALNMDQHLEAAERFMRLALKTQSQCRTTVETLAAIKHPPVVSAKQANFATGHQQVSNGVASAPEANKRMRPGKASLSGAV
jgi:hypothetical protein